MTNHPNNVFDVDGKKIGTFLDTMESSAGETIQTSFNQLTWLFVLMLSLIMLSGCAHFSTAKKAVWQLNPFAAHVKETITAYTLQQELMRFADDYSSMTGEVADNLAAKAKTPQDRVWPLTMKVSQASAAISIAISPNPLAGIMDMTVLVSLTRSSLEDYLVLKVPDADAKEIIEKYKQAEAQVWELAAQILDEKQLGELKNSIARWQKDNPEQHDVSFVRLQNMYKTKAAMGDSSKGYGSIFSLLFIDPFAGLDPAAREMEMTRHTAERAMYQFQRMPRVLDWQLSLVLSKSLAMADVQNLITSADRFSTAADRFSTAAKEFPKQIADERVAIIKDLDAHEPRVKALLGDFRKSLEAVDGAADSVNTAVLSLDRFVANCQTESTPGATNTPGATDPPPSKPFDVTEYGASAAQISEGAREVNTLFNSLDQTIVPQAEAVIDHATSTGTELVDHVFWRAVQCIVIVFVGAVTAMLLYRVIAVRFLKAK